MEKSLIYVLVIALLLCSITTAIASSQVDTVEDEPYSVSSDTDDVGTVYYIVMGTVFVILIAAGIWIRTWDKTENKSCTGGTDA